MKNVLIAAACLLYACSSNPPHENRAPTTVESPYGRDALYQFYIDARGRLIDPRNRRTAVAEEQEYIERVFQNYEYQKALLAKQNKGLALTIFIHGGLNTFATSTARVSRSVKPMLEMGQYPVFISWDSTGLGNYGDHVWTLRRGVRSPVAGPLSSPFVLLEDTLRSIARFPSSIYNEVHKLLVMPIWYHATEENAVDGAQADLCTQKQFDIRDAAPRVGQNSKDFITAANPVKFFTAPFVDGLGSGAWQSMLHRTDFVLRRSNSFDGLSTEEPNLVEATRQITQSEASTDPGDARVRIGETAASSFLRQWQFRMPEERVRLMGHSMGTIISNNIIARYPDLNYDAIVYFAAACPLKDIEQVVAPLLGRRSSQPAHFYNVSLDPYRELAENSAFDLLPRGSLLVWIDDTLGDVNSLEDRTAGRWHNMMRTANQLFHDKDVRSRVHLTRFGIHDGGPQEHGDFGDYEFWREGFWMNRNDQVIRANGKPSTDTPVYDHEHNCADILSMDQSHQVE